MAKRVTMADVARESGFSIATVSLALSGRTSRIPEETVAAVQAEAERLGYVHNASARSLRTGETKTIGFVSAEVTLTRFASAMVRGILDAADECGYAVMIMESGHDEGRFTRAFSMLAGRNVDAYVVGTMASRFLDARHRGSRLRGDLHRGVAVHAVLAQLSHG